jgi:hypothetical protein
MKRALKLTLFILLIILQSQGARSVTEGDRLIPIPKYTAVQAIERVSKYYQDSKGDSERFVIAVAYGRPDMMGPCLGNNYVRGNWQEWSWFVTYTHPRKGESTIVYRLRDNGEVYPLIHAVT